MTKRLLAVLIMTVSACRTETPAIAVPDAPHPSGVSAEARRSIADTLTRLIEDAYDLTGPEPVRRLMALYPDTGSVISASNGRLMTSRDSLEGGIASFWESMGRNMQDPRWAWGDRRIEVLSSTSAVMTTTYTIPHRTPAGDAHVVGGAWTAVFQKRAGAWRIIHEHLSAGSPTPPTQGNPSAPPRD